MARANAARDHLWPNQSVRVAQGSRITAAARREKRVRMKQQPKRYARLFEEIGRTKARRIMEIGTYNGVHAEQMIRTAQRYHPQRIGGVEYFGFDLFETPPAGEHTSRTIPPSMDAVSKRLRKTN